MSTSFTNAFFGSLSISSLASDDISENHDDRSVQSQVELYKRLQTLEEVTDKYFSDRTIQLRVGRDSFSEIEADCCQDFDLQIPKFSHSDVLFLSVECLPDCKDEATLRNLSEDAVRHHYDFHPLRIELKQKNSHDAAPSTVTVAPFSPEQSRTGYSFALTMAHGMSAGSYTLSVAMDNSLGTFAKRLYQAIRVSHKVVPFVRTTNIDVDKPQFGQVAMNDFAFFRFLNKYPGKMLQVTVRPVSEQGVAVGDADLYISNNHEGLLGVSRENYVWKSDSSGSHCISILPGDAAMSRGSHFVIGVLGCRERNEFELSITARDPYAITEITPNSRFDFTLSSSSYAYFSLPVDSCSSDAIELTVSRAQDLPVSSDFIGGFEHVCKTSGRGVYTNSSVLHTGGSTGGNEGDAALPSVFLSTSNIFPNSAHFTWKASGNDGIARIHIESSELKYSSGKCYLSVLNSDTAPEAATRYVVQSRTRPCDSSLSSRDKARRQLFSHVFRDVDGGALSVSERAVSRLDDASLTYGEVDYISFIEFLRASGASDGQVFYDLGSGTGKAVIAAALSDTKFVRCVGIELLPGLCEVSREAVNRARKTAFDSSRHAAPSQRHVVKSTDFPLDQDTIDIADVAHTPPLITISNGNIATEDWSDGDFIFASSLCFSDGLMRQVLDKAAGLKSGSILATSKLPDDYEHSFQLAQTLPLRGSWGYTKTYILLRK